MVLDGFRLRGKQQKLHRKIRKFHFAQKKLRTKLDKLEQDRKDGKVEKAAYDDKKAKIHDEREELRAKVAALEAEEKLVREELKAL